MDDLRMNRVERAEPPGVRRREALPDGDGRVCRSERAFEEHAR